MAGRKWSTRSGRSSNSPGVVLARSGDDLALTMAKHGELSGAAIELVLAQCDGDWEHSYGVSIGTLDNPGWTLDIDLTGTGLQSAPFDEIRDNYEDDRDWLICRVSRNVFEGRCGPSRLEDAITAFIEWADSAS